MFTPGFGPQPTDSEMCLFVCEVVLLLILFFIGNKLSHAIWSVYVYLSSQLIPYNPL